MITTLHWKNIIAKKMEKTLWVFNSCKDRVDRFFGKKKIRSSVRQKHRQILFLDSIQSCVRIFRILKWWGKICYNNFDWVEEGEGGTTFLDWSGGSRGGVTLTSQANKEVNTKADLLTYSTAPSGHQLLHLHHACSTFFFFRLSLYPSFYLSFSIDLPWKTEMST